MSQKDEERTMGLAADTIGPPAGRAENDPAELGKEIAKHLRALYGRQLSEPLPDKFVALLDRLAKAERGS